MAKYQVVFKYNEPVTALNAMKTLPDDATVVKKNKDIHVNVVLAEIELADDAKPSSVHLIPKDNG